MTVHIDLKIGEIQHQIEILQKNLKILESAKQILKVSSVDKTVQRRKSSNSTSALILQILKELEKPLHVKDLNLYLEKKGKTVTNVTITGICSRLVKKGVLKKTYPNTFDLDELQEIKNKGKEEKDLMLTKSKRIRFKNNIKKEYGK